MNNPTSNLTAMQGHTRPPWSDLDGITQAKPLSIWGFLAGLLVVTSPLILGAVGQASEARKADTIKAEYEASLSELKAVNAYLAARNLAMRGEARRLRGWK